MPPLSLVPEDAHSGQPQITPTSAPDIALAKMIEHAVSVPVQLAQVAAGLEGLRVETRSALERLEHRAAATDQSLARLVALGEEANRLRAAELEEARQARAQRAAAAAHVEEVEAQERAARAAWWRTLLEPRMVGLALLAVVLWLLGQGSMIPALLAPAAKP